MPRAGRVLALCLLLLCLLPTAKARARDADYECAMFPAAVLQVSQIPYGSYSHAETLATDILPEGDVFAPFTGEIVHMDSSYGYVVLQSLDKVHWADGSLDYMSVGFMHDNDTTDLQTGQIIAQGTPFYQAGMRSPDGYVTAPHVHLVVIRGKAEGLSNPFRGTDFPFDAFFLAEDTEVLIEGWAAETRYCLHNHAPTDYRGLWVSIASFGSYPIRYDANGGEGEIPGRFKTGGVDLVLSNGAALRRGGYTLIGWSEQPGQNALDYAPGAVFAEDRALTLYAVWEPLDCRVRYLPEGGEDGRSELLSTGAQLMLPDSFSRTGYRLCGWRLERGDGLWYDGDGWQAVPGVAAVFAPGASLTLEENWFAGYEGDSFAFHAIWEPNRYTVRYASGLQGLAGLLVRGETVDSVHVYGEA
ncbi:MAG: InlB B-repeat-containing protein, partial [Oscillospiraceae bacterium]|nr:InlB B-repeat-containing protein [Oscillospiraceae bacterium]